MICVCVSYRICRSAYTYVCLICAHILGFATVFQFVLRPIVTWLLWLFRFRYIVSVSVCALSLSPSHCALGSTHTACMHVTECSIPENCANIFFSFCFETKERTLHPHHCRQLVVLIRKWAEKCETIACSAQTNVKAAWIENVGHKKKHTNIFICTKYNPFLWLKYSNLLIFVGYATGHFCWLCQSYPQNLGNLKRTKKCSWLRM